MGRARDLISLHEAAEQLGVHYMTAYRYVRTGRLPAERDGVYWRVDPADVENLLAPGRARPPEGRVRADGPAKLAARMVAGDEAASWALIENALTATLEPTDVYLDLLVPALRLVGDDWAAGRLSVADEHRATVVAQRVIGRLGPRFARRGRKRGSVLVAAPAGERHALPGAMLSDLLRGVGFDSVDLGADAPPDSLVDAARRAPRLVAVVVGTTSPGYERSIRASVRALRRAGIDVPILVGGGGVPDEATALALGADAWTGKDGSTAIAAVERTLAPRS